MTSPAQLRGWEGHLPPGMAPAALDLLADGSLIGRWLRRWREDPVAPALADVDGSWIIRGELEERTRVAAHRLRRTGLAPGDRFVLSGPTSAALVLAYIAALRAGLVVVPLNPAYTETEVARIVRDSGPAAAAVADDRLAAWIRAAAAATITIAGIGLDELPPGAGDRGIDLASARDPALLVYTSGTTGAPKGAVLSHDNLLASSTAVNVAWRWEPDDCLLLALPLFHVHGLGVGINGSLCAGARVRLRARFHVADVAAECARGVTLFFGVPAMYERLVSTGSAGELRRLRLLVSGSAPLPASLAEAVAAQAGQIPLERYGMTETVMLTSNPIDGPRKPGTVGFPLPAVDVRLGGAGSEVEVRGPNVIEGYFRRPDANAEAFTGDGWFRTGDLGRLDDDGYLTLIGRSKDLIITGGFNVYPREVEEAIGSHPDVREVAVVGRASQRWGEEVTAVVVAARPVSVEALRGHAARRLAPYKVPKRFEFADALPRNALGKVLRTELR